MSNVAFSNRRVLVVEDEVLIGMVLEDILDMLGCVIVGNVTTAAEARMHIGESLDAAILDVNLGSEPSFDLADALIAAGVPVVFATGALRESLPERFQTCPVLEKPYAYPGVEAVLAQIFGASTRVAAAG